MAVRGGVQLGESSDTSMSTYFFSREASSEALPWLCGAGFSSEQLRGARCPTGRKKKSRLGSSQSPKLQKMYAQRLPPRGSTCISPVRARGARRVEAFFLCARPMLRSGLRISLKKKFVTSASGISWETESVPQRFEWTRKMSRTRFLGVSVTGGLGHGLETLPF